jgi:hypothetical protein
MSTNPRKRSAGMKISLTPALYDDLVVVATAIGQTPSTAASFAIGQWVAQQKRTLEAGQNAITAMVEKAGPEFARQLSFLGGEK